MYQRITFSDFLDAFRRHGRETQFSHDAKRALFEYLQDLEEDTGEPIELDVVGLCCDYAEADVDTIIDECGLDASDCADEDEKLELVEDFLDKTTTIVWQDGGTFLYQLF